MTEKSTRRTFLGAAGAAGAVAAMGFNRTAQAAETDGWITQTASFRLNPEKRDEAVAFLEKLCAAVEEKEPGVLAYIVHEVPNDGGRLLFFEIYESQQALADHAQQPHLGEMRQGFAQGIFQPLSAEAPVEIVRLDRIAGFSR